MKISFPSHFDLWEDGGFPVVVNYHGTNMDPITSENISKQHKSSTHYLSKTQFVFNKMRGPIWLSNDALYSISYTV